MRNAPLTVSLSASLLCCILLLSCGENTALKPQSGGRMSEVLVTGSNKQAIQQAVTLLQGIPAQQLPQQEPMFKVSAVHGRLTETTRYARCILTVEVDARNYSRPSLRYERDVYAQPQYIVHLCAASIQQLASTSLQQKLAQLLNHLQRDSELRYLAKHHDANALQQTNKQLDASLWVPTDLVYQKTGKRFLWFSNDDARRMRNICIYDWPGTTLDAHTWIIKRDSVMQRNLPGESPGMYLQTTPESTASKLFTRQQQAHTTRQQQPLLIIHGLWQMHNDAMGGPFVALAIIDSAKQRILTAEAFVYAPGEQKNDMMRALEASLFSLQRNKPIHKEANQ